MNRKTVPIVLFAIAGLTFQACSGESSNQETGESPQANEQGLTEFELEHGIGPVKEAVELGELDPELAAQGKEVYEAKCTACHKPTERYIGPK